MHIESIQLENFKSFRKAQMLDIPKFCVIVGANGSGKSTLFSVFEFLREALDSNVHTALVKLGGSRGFQEVRSRGATGNIEIEIKFRETENAPLVTYYLEVGEANGRPIVAREILKYRRGSGGKPWHFLDFSNGEGEAVTNEIENVTDVSELQRESQKLKSPEILAVKGLAQFERFPAVVALGNLIENWHISDFHISRARPEQEAGYAEHLSREGENLSLVTEYLHTRHPESFQTILQKLTERVPGITSVNAKTTEEGRVLLRFQDGAFEDPFLARYVSDGTIKMFAYLVLLYDTEPHPLLCVEEPENQLYPELLWELAEEFRSYAERGGQVFVSSHSPDFLNAVRIDEVYWMVKEQGCTTIKRALDDKQIAAFMAEGDQMGYLWKEGFFQGAGLR
ncbi:MAG: AAA family ATPase [Gammaproteobacteria bacterium]|nr:AAA family ATPase [Gammaproteobacteria bacterium]MBT4607493.1 AAA family ATPase [Thiotrichales bacterium]MBT3472166.1 AAA family ATPase [Gammaproteobacteria bacterium]MBT3967289.1 AAA family ATPase [Gammaproteobacteria bacterium]MBT4079265.1 AAA family ATPase [Gammaproteobacteria bacterium]